MTKFEYWIDGNGNWKANFDTTFSDWLLLETDNQFKYSKIW